MGVRSFKPTSPSRRRMTVSDFAEVTERGKSKPERSLTAPLSKSGGRSNQGRTSVRFRGGGHKRRYRKIDFKRDKISVPAKVATIEYDPNRTARVALLHYLDGEKRYILAPVGLQKGAIVVSSDDADIQPGNCLPLQRIPFGTQVHAIALKPQKGAQIVRSAGTGAQRKVPEKCRATVGQVGNIENENFKIGKAGRSRWLGKRPHNRGVTMNPVDHPLGGGEGRSSGGRHPVTPWGKPTRGAKTRRNKQTNKYIVARRAKKKRG